MNGTNGIEERLRNAFGAQAETIHPHPGARAENIRRIRRARSSRTMTIPAAAAAVAAAAITGPVALHGITDRGPSGASAGPGGLVDPSTIVRISTRLPGKAVFAAEALGTDGSVVGRSADGQVWRAGPRGGVPAGLGVRAQGGLATGPGFVTWIAPGGWELHCRTPGGASRAITPDDAARVIGPQGTTPDLPVLASGGFVVGSDVMDQPYAVRGCAAPGRMVESPGKGVPGRAVAFAYPTLFAVNTYYRVMREVDVRTQRIVREHPLPTGVRPPDRNEVTHLTRKPGITGNEKGSSGQEEGEALRVLKGKVEASETQERRAWQAAAGDGYFAWMTDGVLRVAARGDWKEKIIPLGTAAGAPRALTRARLTGGDRLIAITVPGARSTVYDTRTGTRTDYPGEVYAAGDRLLWRDGRDYRQAEVR
ncbi:hypothetical protein [Actinomadura roseirufa]|uniref:hypothetical protein n=1 Tax=Actinomadura roseirufa TaxID=2094049 RepID=UPI0010416412|nr:hypothetical protein [Actinomadura roseirufa]